MGIPFDTSDVFIDDKEMNELIREAYCCANQDYLRAQAIAALIASGYDSKEAEEWIKQAEIGVDMDFSEMPTKDTSTYTVVVT